MKKWVKFLFLFSMLVASLGAHGANPGEGRWVAEEVFRSANTGGMTGLINMNSAYTVRDGELQFNVGLIVESAGGVAYVQTPVTITYGLSDTKELGLSTRFIRSSNGFTGVGGAEMKLKWRFRRQTEYLPASAFIFGLIAPVGPTELNEVSSWGARFHILAASESSVTESFFIGMYFDLGAALIDPGAATAQNYYDLNIGFLFPISDDNRLQALFEFNSISGRTLTYLGTDNYSGSTVGIRYASESFKMTMGAQSRSNGSVKFTGTIGFEF